MLFRNFLRTRWRCLFFIGLLLFCVTSCSRGKLHIMEANYFHSRGKYNDAIAAYFNALEYEETAMYAEYGLGTVFYSLDEGNAALERFNNSMSLLETFSANEHKELRYRNKYNSGIVHFIEGDFVSAAEAFKDALRENPRKIDAKRNLELSQLSLSMQRAGESRSDTQEQENESRSILFEYLRQREQSQWRSREWETDDQQIGPDY